MFFAYLLVNGRTVQVQFLHYEIEGATTMSIDVRNSMLYIMARMNEPSVIRRPTISDKSRR